jgi:anti-sigma factor RsiW
MNLFEGEMPMRCRTAKRRFSAYQDGELAPQRQEEVRNHLLSCRACREEYAKFEQAWDALEALQEIPPPPGFYTQLVRRIDRSHGKKTLPVPRYVFQLLRGPVLASILMAAGLLMGTYLGTTLVRSGFLLVQPDRVEQPGGFSLSSLDVFDPVPPGTLAHGYLQLANYDPKESR